MSDREKYKSLCDRMMTRLKLETVPVAVQFSTEPPEGLTQLNSTTKACSMLDLARLEKRVFYTRADNHGRISMLEQVPSGADAIKLG